MTCQNIRAEDFTNDIYFIIFFAESNIQFQLYLQYMRMQFLLTLPLISSSSPCLHSVSLPFTPRGAGGQNAVKGNSTNVRNTKPKIYHFELTGSWGNPTLGRISIVFLVQCIVTCLIHIIFACRLKTLCVGVLKGCVTLHKSLPGLQLKKNEKKKLLHC